MWEIPFAASMALTIMLAFIISFAATPLVKKFAEKVGAMDVPKDSRRVHDHPIPRMGGLAIFLGFLLSVVVFADITMQVRGMLLGAILIVFVGVVDDIVSLRAIVKLLLQIVAAVIAVLHGERIEFFSHPNVFGSTDLLLLDYLSGPITVLWIVAVTNSVNLIDGLDGLAVGVSTISSVTMIVVALILGNNNNIALILAALAGACVGFIPYNFNPAKIFMGDTGALLLGYVLATASVIGFFKFSTAITLVVPLCAMGLPLADTAVAFCRRILTGKSPFTPDRGHLHHRLLDSGFSQKQTVFILYGISAVLGLVSVLLTTRTELRIVVLIVAILISVIIGLVLRARHREHLRHLEAEKQLEDQEKETCEPQVDQLEGNREDGENGKD